MPPMTKKHYIYTYIRQDMLVVDVIDEVAMPPHFLKPRGGK